MDEVFTIISLYPTFYFSLVPRGMRHGSTSFRLPTVPFQPLTSTWSSLPRLSHKRREAWTISRSTPTSMTSKMWGSKEPGELRSPNRTSSILMHLAHVFMGWNEKNQARFESVEDPKFSDLPWFNGDEFSNSTSPRFPGSWSSCSEAISAAKHGMVTEDLMSPTKT